MPAAGRCHFYSLLAESDKVGRELTKEFYVRYADIRQDAFEQLGRDNAQAPRGELLGCTQKLLDRVLFCAFCEDRGLLPTETIRRAYEHRDPYHPRPIWENFRGLFRAINRGNAALGIHAYNGGLFDDDPLLDALQVSDEVCGYFYELGLRVLKPGGLLSFIVTNKWMKAGYGEPLRRLFAERAWIESVVDFGHAKQIFRDADVFPSIIVARRPSEAPKPTTARLCAIPRDQLRVDDLSRQIEMEGVELPLAQLGSEAWQLEPAGVNDLLAKIRERGRPLAEFAGVKPYRGVLTGLNEAFLIDSGTRNELVAADARCADVIRPYTRGQDLDRWASDWAGLWMIAIKSSGDHAWPWTDAADPEAAFADAYPSLYARFKPMEAALRKRQDKGRNWWELRSCAYWNEFDKPKIFYQDIAWRPQFSLDCNAMTANNTVHFVTTDDVWALAVLNSPAGWWYSWRSAQHGKDEALRLFSSYMQKFPIPDPSDAIRGNATVATNRLVQVAHSQHETRRIILDWLRVEHEIEKPTLKLQSPVDLDSDAFVAEVKKIRGKRRPLSAAALKSLRDEHTRTLAPAQALAAEALDLEHEINDLVNAAYGLTPEEVALLWQTAPPRMPLPAP